MRKYEHIVETLKPIATYIGKRQLEGKRSCIIMVYIPDGFSKNVVGKIDVINSPMFKDYKNPIKTFVAVNFALYHFFKERGYKVEPTHVLNGRSLEEEIFERTKLYFKTMEWTIRW